MENQWLFVNLNKFEKVIKKKKEHTKLGQST